MIMKDMTYRLFRPDLPEPTADDAEVAFRQLLAMPVPWATPDDVTNAVLFLASERARPRRCALLCAKWSGSG
jgi:(+)-trans-carveol dehydrogenase